MIAGLLGVLFSRHAIQIEVFTGWTHPEVGYIVPILFITVACGACSGFHSIVSSGTTSKQISCETDIKKVNYGGMLVEGILAVFALGTIAILSEAERSTAGTPVAIFATGASKFMGSIGLPQSLAMEFTLLAVSTFLLTTLDTCTRLSRFILEEFLQVRSQMTRWIGTAAVLVVPAIAMFVEINGQPSWKVVWPLFGSTNQLMAALALLTFLVFLKSRAIKYGFIIPATVIMVIMPLWALALLAIKQGPMSLLGGIATVMFILGGFVTVMSLKFVLDKAPST
jgi:carbon starvation protein